MSKPWWGREAFQTLVNPKTRKLVQREFGLTPQLHADDTQDIIAEIRERHPSFADDWAYDSDRLDAGGVLVELFGRQVHPLLRRVNRLPDKALIEFLDNAGIGPEPARPAEAMVQFTLSNAAEDSVFVPRGFQIGAPPQDGQGDLVVFETTHSLRATPTEIETLISVEGAAQWDLTSANENVDESFAPFGDKPGIGNSLIIGLKEVPQISGDITLGIRVAAAPGEPPPVSDGGVAPIPLPVSPVLQWSAFVESQFVPMDVKRDETSNLWKSGIVQLRVPQAWKPKVLFGQDAKKYWIRLRLIHGSFQKPPRLTFVRINMARVSAIETVRDEILQPIDGPDSNRLQLTKTPVVRETLEIVVDATPFDDDDDAELRSWQEVDDLAQYGPQDRVFTLDPTQGIVTFGDGVNGVGIPPGFRNVRAERYQVGGGKRGAVESDQITTLLNSASSVTAATNPLPASGGVDIESQLEAVLRGPATIRSGRRAVTVDDYAVWARFVSGADVRKAKAIAGLHPQFPGQRIAGVVGVLVVPPVGDEGPPIPDEDTLRAVSRFLSEKRAPAGVEIVADAPKYRRLRTEIGFVPDTNADVGQIISLMTKQLDSYLHPLEGGDDDRGWPFGGTLVFSKLMRRLLSLPNVHAVPRLRLIIDGVPQKPCANVPLRPTELFWAEGHQIVTVESEEAQ